jgi:transposase-like protein
MNKSTECPTCENRYPHPTGDNSYYCDECGKEWTVELHDLDDQILDHAESIIELMKAKGMTLDGYQITIWQHDNEIQVQHICQNIETKTRKI